MVVAMRLMRMGTTHRPVYRISVGDSRKAPTAKFIEHIGTYDPNPDKMGNKQLRLNVARAKYWIAMGCQPSSVVARLLSRFHLIPVPPQRITVPTGTLLHKVLAGEDVRALVPKPGDAARTKLVDPVKHRVPAQNRRMKELTKERIKQIIKQGGKWKLQAFPFEKEPTNATMAAWTMARAFHQNIRKHPSKSEWKLPSVSERPAGWLTQKAAGTQVVQRSMGASAIEPDFDVEEDEEFDLIAKHLAPKVAALKHGQNDEFDEDAIEEALDRMTADKEETDDLMKQRRKERREDLLQRLREKRVEEEYDEQEEEALRDMEREEAEEELDEADIELDEAIDAEEEAEAISEMRMEMEERGMGEEDEFFEEEDENETPRRRR